MAHSPAIEVDTAYSAIMQLIITQSSR